MPLPPHAIWDVHCHLANVPGATPHERMANFIAYADRLEIERVTIFMGWPFTQDPTPERMRRENDQVLEALQHWHHRAFGFVYLNPQHVDASLAEFERCVIQGPMVGVKLWVAMRCDDSAVDTLVRAAATAEVPILQHTWIKSTGNLPGESTPAELAALAARHPEAKFIAGHTGGNWELGVRSLRGVKNVSVETGGFDPTSGMVDMAVRELGVDRILFGSDAGGRSFASQLAKVEESNLDPEEMSLIYSGNYRKLLEPILKTKGVTVD